MRYGKMGPYCIFGFIEIQRIKKTGKQTEDRYMQKEYLQALMVTEEVKKAIGGKD